MLNFHLYLYWGSHTFTHTKLVFFQKINYSAIRRIYKLWVDEKDKPLTPLTLNLLFSFISSYPSLEWQQAINEPSASIPYKDAVAIAQTNWTTPSYMEWLSKPETESQCYMTLSNFRMVSQQIQMLNYYVTI